jgi:hypothetical protein
MIIMVVNGLYIGEFYLCWELLLWILLWIELYIAVHVTSHTK